MSFEDQLWQWLGSGSVRLAWQGKAALQIQLDLAGDAKEAWTGLGAPTPATSSFSAPAGAADGVMGALTAQAIEDFAFDLGLNTVPGLRQLAGLKDLLLSGFHLSTSVYAVYDVRKQIRGTALSQLAAVSAESLFSAVVSDAESKCLHFGAAAVGVTTAIVDPIGFLGGLAPLARLGIKLAWLKMAYTRFQRVNEMLADRRQFTVDVLDLCPYLGCYLLTTAATSDLIAGVVFGDARTHDAKRIMKELPGVAALEKRAASVCANSVFLLPPHHDIMVEEFVAPGQKVTIPRLFMTTRKFDWAQGSDRFSEPANRIWHSQERELTLKHLKNQDLRLLNGDLTDFSFEVQGDVGDDILGCGARQGDCVWFSWPPGGIAEIERRRDAFTRAIDKALLRYDGGLKDKLFRVERAFQTADSCIYPVGMRLTQSGDRRGAMKFNGLVPKVPLGKFAMLQQLITTRNVVFDYDEI